jgi:hypothetical protein
VPHDADALVALRAGGEARALHGPAHRVELVVTGDLLQHLAVFGLEGDEVVYEVEEAALLEHALNQHVEGLGAFRLVPFAGDRAPAGEALRVGGDRPDLGVHVVGGDEQHIGHEQGGDVPEVGLELSIGVQEPGARVGRVFQLDHGERQSIDVHDDVGDAQLSGARAAVHHVHLADGQPVVLVGVVEVDQPHQRAADAAAFAGHLEGEPVREQGMEVPVFEGQGQPLAAKHLADGLRDGGVVEGGVESGNGRFEPAAQDHVGDVRALEVDVFRVQLVGRGDLVAQRGEPLQGGVFEDGFVDGFHGLVRSCKGTLRSVDP